MQLIRKILSAGLFWFDIALIGATFVIGLGLGLYGLDLWAQTSAEVTAMQVPWYLWREPSRLVAWVIAIANWPLGLTVLRLWGQVLLAGFCLYAAALALHEAFVRFRIRLG